MAGDFHHFQNVFRREMPVCNRQQAFLPEGATVLHNPVGYRPGLPVYSGGRDGVHAPRGTTRVPVSHGSRPAPYLKSRQAGG